MQRVMISVEWEGLTTSERKRFNEAIVEKAARSAEGSLFITTVSISPSEKSKKSERSNSNFNNDNDINLTVESETRAKSERSNSNFDDDINLTSSETKANSLKIRNFDYK